MGYRWYDEQHIQPAFPFGFGLSYTQLPLQQPEDRTEAAAREPSANVSVTVRNTGTRTGWAVPELYVSLPSPTGVPEPPLQLKGFDKVELAPHKSARVTHGTRRALVLLLVGRGQRVADRPRLR